MKKPPVAFAARILAVLFSTSVATAYVSCRSSEQANSAQQPANTGQSLKDNNADPPGDENVIPFTTKSGRVYLPGSKSTPADPPLLPGSKSIIVTPPRSDDPNSDQPKPPSQHWLPGSKSAPISPEFLEQLRRESEEAQKNKQPSKQKGKSKNP